METRPLIAFVAAALMCSTAGAETFYFNGTGAIADDVFGNGTACGTARVLTANSNVANPIQDVVLTIAMNHTWVGDLRIRLGYTPTGSSTPTVAWVINRVNAATVVHGSSNNLNGSFTFVDGATSFNTTASAIVNLTYGAYSPFDNPFDGTYPLVEFADYFRGQPGTGTWTLTFEDCHFDDIGAVTSASIALKARPPACLSDLNSDGLVNTTDLTFFLGRFGGTCP